MLNACHPIKNRPFESILPTTARIAGGRPMEGSFGAKLLNSGLRKLPAGFRRLAHENGNGTSLRIVNFGPGRSFPRAEIVNFRLGAVSIGRELLIPAVLQPVSDGGGFAPCCRRSGWVGGRGWRCARRVGVGGWKGPSAALRTPARRPCTPSIQRLRDLSLRPDIPA